MTAIQNRAESRRVEDNQRRDLGTEQARQGMTTGHIRWVLVIGVFLAALAFIFVWMAVPKPHTLPSTTGAAQVPVSAPGPTSSNPAAQ